MTLFLCFLLIHSPNVDRAIKSAEICGRVVLLSDSDADRLGQVVHVPPGMPPVLSFRYMEGSHRHGFSDLDLVVDDAGH